MRQILIKKYSGDLIPFDPNKIKITCLRGGESLMHPRFAETKVICDLSLKK